MAFGPAKGLAMLAALARVPALAGYAPLPAAQGDCLWRQGRLDEAAAAFRTAAALAGNGRERDFLLARAAACTG
jgi:predicted RNA polymerase sigma factor